MVQHTIQVARVRVAARAGAATAPMTGGRPT